MIESKKEWVSKLIAAANIINTDTKRGKASYFTIPVEKIEWIANELNISFDEAVHIIETYFKPKNYNEKI